jgi:DnaK suppressor protein
MSARINAGELEGFRHSLLEQARKLRAAMAHDRQQIGGGDGSLPPAFDDGRDEPTLDVMRDIDVSELARRGEELNAVEAALERLTDGTFGFCVDCGGDISRERLNAAPHSLRCLACQATAEKKMSHPASL